MESEVLKDSYERTVFSTPPNGNERLDFEFGEVHSTYVDGREIAYREMKVRTEDEEKSVIDILEGNLVLGEYLDEGERKVEVGRISREIDPEDVRKALDKIMTPEFLMRETGITPGDIYLSN